MSLRAQWLAQSAAVPIQRAAAYRVLREDKGGESGGEDFLAEELHIAAALGAAVAQAGEGVAPAIAAAIASGTSIERVTDAVEQAQAVMSQVFETSGVEPEVRSNIRRVLRTGGSAAAGGGGGAGAANILDDFPRFGDILDGMVRSAKYYTNNYFNTQVVPALYRDVERVITSTDAVTDASWTAVREALAARLKSVPYWRVVANAAASRAYHYGVVKGGELGGYRAYQIVAVVDEKTSDICLYMNGKTFWLADASAHMERVAAAEGDEIKQVAPWLKLSAIEELDAAGLRDAGFLVPPFHGSCRTTVRLLRS